MNVKITCLLAAAIMLLLAGCTAPKEETPTPSAQPEQTGLAYVKDVQIQNPEPGSTKVEVIAQGELPDNCSKIEKTDVKLVNGTFLVSITSIRQPGPDCGGMPVDFRQPVSIDISELPAGKYPVVVNQVSGEFEIRASAAVAPTPTSASSESALTPSLEPTATQPASPAPTEAQPTPTPTQPTPVQPTETQAVPTQPAPTQPAATEQTALACEDKAAFYGDITVPDDTLFRQGETFVKTWRFFNAGTCTWDSDYSLVFIGGDQMNSPLSTPLSQTPPGKTIDVSVDLTAPTTGGQFTARYLIQSPAGSRFGINGQGLIWTQIKVNFVTSGDTQTSGSGGSQTSTTTGTNIPAAQGCNYQRNSDYENQMLALLNDVRAQNSLGRLSMDSKLSDAALAYSLDMACNNRVDFVHHTDSDGNTPAGRIAAAGYQALISRENVYAGGSPQDAFDYWMEDPDDPVHKFHRAAILNPDVSEVGIAYIYTATSDFGGYFTVDFAKPK